MKKVAVSMLVVMLAALLATRQAGAALPLPWQQMPLPTGMPIDRVTDLYVMPGTGNLVVRFDSQGVFRSSDHGQTWLNLTYNLPATTGGGHTVANAQGDLLFVPADAAVRGLYRLPVNGTNWIAASVNYTGMSAADFLGRMVVNGTGEVVVASAGSQVLISTNGGATLGPPIIALSGAALFALNQSPLDPNIITLATETGPVWRSTNGGHTWTDIQQPSSAGDIRLGYDQWGELFASATHDSLAAGWTLGKWVSGTNWVRSDTGLPTGVDTRATALSSSGQMFLGNYDVFMSTNNGANWAVAGTNFPNLGTAQHLRTLAVGQDGYLYAGSSQGTNTVPGVWRLPIQMVWAGGASNVWSASATNWNSNLGYVGGMDTRLQDNATNTAINLTTNVLPLSFTVTNNRLAYSLGGAGSINGTTSLVKYGTNTLTINNSNGYTGGSIFSGGVTTVNHTNGLGSGPVTLANAGAELHFGSTVNIGALTVGTNTLVAADASGQHVIVTGGLTIAGSSSNTPAGTVQLHDNSMIVHNGNLLAVRAQIKAARTGGTWAGQGITTDLSTNSGGKVTTLAYAQGSDTNLAISSIHGQAIAGTDVVVKYTYVGDANMDGSVDGLDIAKWAVNFTGALGLSPTADPVRGWTQGDWNFDGSVDGLDAAIWATNFTGALGGGGLSGLVVDVGPEAGVDLGAVAILEGMGMKVVPEPASVVLVTLGAIGGLASRRHHGFRSRMQRELRPTQALT